MCSDLGGFNLVYFDFILFKNIEIKILYIVFLFNVRFENGIFWYMIIMLFVLYWLDKVLFWCWGWLRLRLLFFFLLFVVVVFFEELLKLFVDGKCCFWLIKIKWVFIRKCFLKRVIFFNVIFICKVIVIYFCVDILIYICLWIGGLLGKEYWDLGGKFWKVVGVLL